MQWHLVGVCARARWPHWDMTGNPSWDGSLAQSLVNRWKRVDYPYKRRDETRQPHTNGERERPISTGGGQTLPRVEGVAGKSRLGPRCFFSIVK